MNRLKRFSVMSTSVVLALTATAVFADAGGGGDITALATKVSTQAGALAQLLTVIAYVAGVGFALAGILQFKAHKENPQQTPLSKPIMMIVVAACLLFLPAVLNIAGSSLFGASAQSSAKYKSDLSGN